MKYLISLLMGLLIGAAHADQHGNKLAGMDLSNCWPNPFIGYDPAI
ncbi:MAG TPA: hypothetical protein QF611_17300 [Pseudomonadales bacterium]|jgi:hypothetical protein|nr:hypothetical protein [Pseudomonadales bacterium]HJP52791.1 hypothetical protein [Pseudomonadales bacterium]